MTNTRQRFRTALRSLIGGLEPADPVHLARIVEESTDDENYATVDMLNPDLTTGVRRDIIKNRLRAQTGAVVRVARLRKEHGPAELAIVGVDRVSYSGFSLPSLLELHGPDHGLGQPDEIMNLHWYQIYPLRVQPESGLEVRIQPGTFFADGAYHGLTEYETLDLTANQPGSGRRYVTVSLTSAGAVQATNGSIVTDTLTADDIPLAPTGDYPLAAVALSSFAAEIVRTDIVPIAHLMTVESGITAAYIHNAIAQHVAPVWMALMKHVTEGI